MSRWAGFLVLPVLMAGCAATGTSSPDAFLPPGGQGRPVLLLSGASGPAAYVFMAQALAAQGYYVILTDGHDFAADDAAGDAHLRQAIDRLQHSPHAIPGKAAVIGLSLGGGAVLAHASTQPDVVDLVVAYYPAVRDIRDKPALARRWTVPTLVFAAGRDAGGCCLLGAIQAMTAAAKERGAPVELVAYPEAGHGFNLYFNYNAPAADDAWQRTLAALRERPGA